MNGNKQALCLTVAEMAAELRIGLNKAYLLVNRADFPAIKAGNRIVIVRPALEKWLMDQVNDGAALLDIWS